MTNNARLQSMSRIDGANRENGLGPRRTLWRAFGTKTGQVRNGGALGPGDTQVAHESSSIEGSTFQVLNPTPGSRDTRIRAGGRPVRVVVHAGEVPKGGGSATHVWCASADCTVGPDTHY